MQFFLDHAMYVHVSAMTILWVYVVLAMRQLGEHAAIKWNLLLVLCLLAFSFRVIFAQHYPKISHFFKTFLFMVEKVSAAPGICYEEFRQLLADRPHNY